MSNYQNKGVILGLRPIGEADLLVTFLDEERGKVKGIAKNAKSSKTRFGGLLQLGMELLVNYKENLKSDLVMISEVSRSGTTTMLSSNLDNFYAMSIALEIAERFTQPEQAVKKKYQLLVSYLEKLHISKNAWAALHAFAWKWIALSGFRPNLSECSTCGERNEISGWRFTPDAGGVLCKDCYNGPSGIVVSNSVLQLIEKLIVSKFDDVKDLTIDSDLRHETNGLLGIELQHLLGRPLNSYKYIRLLEGK